MHFPVLDDCIQNFVIQYGHVLLEKGIEVTLAKAEEILAAERASTAKLMMAYRLHSEPATLDLIEKIRSGTLGEVTLFTSVFTQMLDPGNHRAKNGDDAGPVLDMGLYPLNAARLVFEALAGLHERSALELDPLARARHVHQAAPHLREELELAPVRLVKG